MPEVSTLEVRLYGEPIATINHVGGDRTLFAFLDTYIADEGRPTLGAGFKDEFGGLFADFPPTQTKLIPWLSNLLPEGHLRKYLAERARVKREREFFLLWVLGRDLPGAVTVQPADGEAWPPQAHDGQGRNDDARANALRFSLAGVQLKFSALESGRSGLTIPVSGVGGDWIVKLPSREFAGAPENEFSMMTLARLVGIDVPPIQLLDVMSISGVPDGVETLGGQAYAIRRFDRLTDGGLVHIEDFAQVFGVYPADKYESATMRRIAQVVGIEGQQSDIAEFVRRLVFNALIGNADMHLKNWSLTYPDRRHAALAPAYDFVATTAYLPDEKFALKFSRTARFDELTLDELTHLAGKARLPEKLVLNTARETVDLFQHHWKVEKSNLPLAKPVIDAVEHQLQLVPLAGGR